MAKETKFVDVPQNAAQTSMNDHAIFGWEVRGTPQARNTTRITNKGDVVREVKVSITYMRNPSSIPNYSEIVELEREYFKTRGYETIIKIIGIVVGLFGFIGILGVWAGKEQYRGISALGTAICVVISIILVKFFMKGNNRRGEIAEEVRSLMEES